MADSRTRTPGWVQGLVLVHHDSTTLGRDLWDPQLPYL